MTLISNILKFLKITYLANILCNLKKYLPVTEIISVIGRGVQVFSSWQYKREIFSFSCTYNVFAVMLNFKDNLKIQFFIAETNCVCHLTSVRNCFITVVNNIDIFHKN